MSATAQNTAPAGATGTLDTPATAAPATATPEETMRNSRPGEMTSEQVQQAMQSLVTKALTAPESPEAGQSPAPVEEETAPEGQPPDEPQNDGTEEEEETPAPADGQQWPESAQRRVDKLTAKIAKLKEEQVAKEAELAEAKARKDEAPAPAADTSTPLAHIESPEQLTAYANNVRKLGRDIARYTEGVMPPHETEQFEAWAKTSGLWDKDTEQPNLPQLKEMRFSCEDALQQYVPQRAQYLAARVQADRQAEVTYSFWKDKTSKEFVTANQLINAAPEIKRFPNYKLWVGRMMAGWQLEQTAAAGKGTATRALPPRQPATPANAAPRPPSNEAKQRQLRDQAFASGNQEDVQAWVKSLVS